MKKWRNFRVETKKPNRGGSETVYLIFPARGQKAIGYVSKIRNTRTDTHPFKAFRIGYDGRVVANSFRAYYADSRYAQDGAFAGGKEAAFAYAVSGHEGGDFSRGEMINPRGKFRGRDALVMGNLKMVKQFTDRELQHMIQSTTGVAKKFFLKEAGRRVAEEMRTGARKNPPKHSMLYGARSRQTYRDAPSHLIGLEVYEIRYRHATDGKDYSHVFETGVIMLGQSDGTIKIESATGKKLWEEINV